jgi:hypothetical protein
MRNWKYSEILNEYSYLGCSECKVIDPNARPKSLLLVSDRHRMMKDAGNEEIEDYCVVLQIACETSLLITRDRRGSRNMQIYWTWAPIKTTGTKEIRAYLQ